jgi:hypothetical protein
VSYDRAIYLGCAAHYHCGRPGYSPQLEAVLTQEAGLDGNGRLADADCGLTVRLAYLFGQSVGLDPDAGMLAAGCRAAEEKTVMNIRWVQGLAGRARGRARGVPAAGLWPVLPLDRRTARAETVYGMLERGGALALIVRTVTVRPGHRAPGCLRLLMMRLRRWCRNISDLPGAPDRQFAFRALAVRGEYRAVFR